MVDYAELSRDDVVLEIGAGTGNLTNLLAKRAGKVIAIERDRRLFKLLRAELRKHSNVNLIHADALRIEFPRFDKVVANLPYGISSDITFKLLEHDFKLVVLMYQREFAQRLVAQPGSTDYSRLTVNVFYRAQVELLEEVPPSAFIPEPEVTSTVVRLRPRAPPFQIADEKIFFSVVRALFQHRRQKVRNALYHSFEQVFPGTKLGRAERRELIDEKIPKRLVDARVMDLPPEKIGEIANRLRARPNLRA
jgi:16S rRNA (adenine1518-N6/adenine1519-N6)-dimethyltransferase